jgi:2-phospho-L-lactate guanylyltransferase
MDQLSGAETTFGAVLALKPTERAKSRLASVPDPVRRRLAWTMAVDTLTAVTTQASPVVVVSDQPGLAAALRGYGLHPRVVAEAGRTGLNAALSHGADVLLSLGLRSIVACVGDLPALTPASLRRVFRGTAGRSWSYLSDADGTGTTMLLTTNGVLKPHFQGASAAAHAAAGAIALTDEILGAPVPDARRDVDSEADLVEAYHLGLGRLTGALFDPASGQLGQYRSITVAESVSNADMAEVTPALPGHVAVTADGFGVRLPFPAVDPSLRSLSPRQRLHAMVADGTVLSAWL